MKVFLNTVDIEEYVEETLGELKYKNPNQEVSILQVFDEMMEEGMNEFFPSNQWSEYDFYTAIANYKGKSYEISIQENGCCEATNEHRIMYMKHSVKEIPFVTEPKKLKFETITYNEVQDNALESLIKEVYGQQICIAAETEWTYNVPNMITADNEECDDEILQYFVKTGCMDEYGAHETLSAIMADLCKRGHMPIGTYGIYIIH